MCFCFEKEEEEKIGWRFRSGIVVSRSDLVNTCEADYLFCEGGAGRYWFRSVEDVHAGMSISARLI